MTSNFISQARQLRRLRRLRRLRQLRQLRQLRPLRPLRQLNFWRERQRGRAWAFSDSFLAFSSSRAVFLSFSRFFDFLYVKLHKLNEAKVQLKDRTRKRTRVGRWRSREKAMAPRTNPLRSISQGLHSAKGQ